MVEPLQAKPTAKRILVDLLMADTKNLLANSRLTVNPLMILMAEQHMEDTTRVKTGRPMAHIKNLLAPSRLTANLLPSLKVEHLMDDKTRMRVDRRTVDKNPNDKHMDSLNLRMIVKSTRADLLMVNLNSRSTVDQKRPSLVPLMVSNHTAVKKSMRIVLLTVVKSLHMDNRQIAIDHIVEVEVMMTITTIVEVDLEARANLDMVTVKLGKNQATVNLTVAAMTMMTITKAEEEEDANITKVGDQITDLENQRICLGTKE